MPKVRITVLKRTLHEDLLEHQIQDEASRRSFGRCPIFTEGQTFVSEDWPTKPDGFCERAWPDIRHEAAMVMYEATVPWITAEGFTITCCNDGLRPVIFKIERVEDSE
jgi:uncharacterized repeat protein (TIGR04076 family)